MNKAGFGEIVRNALLGQAVGDAFGVPVEFLSREEVRAIDLKEMAGKDSGVSWDSWWGNRIPKGSWSDDTSMTLASMASFIRKNGRIDYEDQMRQFLRWWDHKEYCCLSSPFGLGGTVSDSMERFRKGTEAIRCGGTGTMDNGNGALMRILPFSMYCIAHALSPDQTAEVVSNGSAMTHGHDISKMSCMIWTELLRGLAEGHSLKECIVRLESIPYGKWFSAEAVAAHSMITEKKTLLLTEKDIGETGYVVDTLYSAIYSLVHAEDYEMSIRNAVGLGYDTDTAGAVAGTAAGILYGADGIPARWTGALRKREVLEETARQFAQAVWEN